MRRAAMSRRTMLAGAIGLVIVVSVVAIGTFEIPSRPPTGYTSTSTPTTESSPNTEPMMQREDCARLNSTGTVTCTSSSSSEGEVQAFNMSTWDSNNASAYEFHEWLFGVQANRSSTLQYTIDTTNYGFFGTLGYYDVPFQIYFVNQTLSSAKSLSEAVSSHGEIVFNQTDPDYVEELTGNVTAHSSGMYVFVFPYDTANPAGTVRFFVQDSSIVQHGIWFKIGAPWIRDETVNGSSGTIEAGYEQWPVTVYSNSTTTVVLNDTTTLSGVWLAFTPSVLLDVGPNGSSTTMLMAGAQTENPGYETPDSPAMFITALGADGSMGESYFLIDAVSPVSAMSSPSRLLNLHLSDFENETTAFVVGAVYSPQNGSESRPLYVTLSIAGLLEGGAVQKLPNWIQLSNQSLSFQLDPDQPYYYAIQVGASGSIALGSHTIVIDETVDGQEFTSYLTLSVLVPPPPSLG